MSAEDVCRPGDHERYGRNDSAGHDLGDFTADVAFHDVEYLGPTHGGVSPSRWRLAC